MNRLCIIRPNRRFTKHHLLAHLIRNLIKNPSHEIRPRMVSNKAVKYSTEVPKQQHESERKGMLDMAWLALYTHGQRCLISRKLIWFELLRNFVQADGKIRKISAMNHILHSPILSKLTLNAGFKINRMTQEICRRLSDYKFCIAI